MESPQSPHITDELLSAYIDNALNEDECQQIEYAVAHDPEIAWRLESMRHTVRLLKEMPHFAPPRALTFSAAMATKTAPAAPIDQQVREAIASTHRSVQARAPILESSDEKPGFWHWFWLGGNPLFRNAAVACALLLFAFLVANFVEQQLESISTQMSSTQSLSSQPTMTQEILSIIVAQATETSASANSIVMAPTSTLRVLPTLLQSPVACAEALEIAPEEAVLPLATATPQFAETFAAPTDAESNSAVAESGADQVVAMAQAQAPASEKPKPPSLGDETAKAEAVAELSISSLSSPPTSSPVATLPSVQIQSKIVSSRAVQSSTTSSLSQPGLSQNRSVTMLSEQSSDQGNMTQVDEDSSDMNRQESATNADGGQAFVLGMNSTSIDAPTDEEPTAVETELDAVEQEMTGQFAEEEAAEEVPGSSQSLPSANDSPVATPTFSSVTIARITQEPAKLPKLDDSGKPNVSNDQIREDTPTEEPSSANIETATVTPEAISSIDRADDSNRQSIGSVNSEQTVGTRIWRILQFAAGLGFLLFSLLWWRSRTFHPASKQVQ